MRAAHRRPPNAVAARRHSRRHSLPARLASGPLFLFFILLSFPSPILRISLITPLRAGDFGLRRQTQRQIGSRRRHRHRRALPLSRFPPPPLEPRYTFPLNFQFISSNKVLQVLRLALSFCFFFFFRLKFLSLCSYRDVCDGCWSICHPAE